VKLSDPLELDMIAGILGEAGDAREASDFMLSKQ
jgi:hypothetical protein